MPKPTCKIRHLRERTRNLLANGSLRMNRKGPIGWQIHLYRCPQNVLEPSARGLLVQPTGTGYVSLTQTIRAWPGKYYRLDLDAVPAGRLRGKQRLGELQATFRSLKADRQIEAHTPPAMRVAGDCPPIWRAHYRAPAGTGKLQIRLRLRVQEPLIVRRVRLVECGESILSSHPLAIPPEPWQDRPPCLPNAAVLCDGRRDDRPLLRWLRGVFGAKTVRRIGPDRLRRLAKAADGFNRRGTTACVIDLPAARAPHLADLLALADGTLVIVSLQTFAGSLQRAGIRGVGIRYRTTAEDMPGGQIVHAGFFTRGLALADVVPCGWSDGRDDFAHRYITLSKAAKARLAERGIEPAILTDTGHDATSKHPLAFYRSGKKGALIAIDPDGLEAPPAGENERLIHELLWRNSLARETTTLGQFVVADLDYTRLRIDLVDLPRRFPLVEDLAVRARLTGQGNPPPIWLLPATGRSRSISRPTLLVRSGFSPADWPAVYGLICWLKRLAHKAAREDQVAWALLERIRVLACPVSRPHKWPGCPEDITALESDFDDDALAGVIEMTTGTGQNTIIVVPDRSRADRIRACLDFGGGRNHAWQGLDADSPTAPATGPPRIIVDPKPFTAGAAAQARRLDVPLCKVLLPSTLEARPADSVILTDLAARILERLAFGAVGFIAANRNWRPQTVTPNHSSRARRKVFAIRPSGDARPVDVRRRKRIRLPAGWTAITLDE